MATRQISSGTSRKAGNVKAKGRPKPSETRNSAASLSTSQLLQQLKQAQATIDELKESLSQVARRSGDAASAAMSSASESVSRAAADVSGKAAAAAQSAAQGASTMGAEIEGFTRRNPVAALAAALCMGLVIGIATRDRK